MIVAASSSPWRCAMLGNKALIQAPCARALSPVCRALLSGHPGVLWEGVGCVTWIGAKFGVAFGTRHPCILHPCILHPCIRVLAPQKRPARPRLGFCRHSRPEQPRRCVERGSCILLSCRNSLAPRRLSLVLCASELLIVPVTQKRNQQPLVIWVGFYCWCVRRQL